MPYIAGMSLGSWVLLIFILFWAFVAIKCYFFGGFKKRPKGQKAHIGTGCCGEGDNAPIGSKDASPCAHCASSEGCGGSAVKKNNVEPIYKPVE